MVTHQLQVERRTAKAHRPKTDALPLDYAEAFLLAKFRLDPSNRLVTVHERHRQTDRRTDRTGQDRQTADRTVGEINVVTCWANRFTNGRPKTAVERLISDVNWN